MAGVRFASGVRFRHVWFEKKHYMCCFAFVIQFLEYVTLCERFDDNVINAVRRTKRLNCDPTQT